MKELLRIEENSGDFFFKYPQKLQVADDGSIFIYDNRQLLKFTPEGKFVKNLFKYGQGPGEILLLSNYIFSDNTLIIHDNMQSKVLVMNMAGNLLKEIKYTPRGEKTLIRYFRDHYYFVEKEPPDTGGVLKIADLDHLIVSVSSDGRNVTEKARFPLQYLMLKSGNQSFTSTWGHLVIKFDGPDRFYMSNTSEYMVKLFSLKEHKFLFQFKREFERIKVPPKTKKKRGKRPGYNKISIGGKFYDVPRPKYLNDIQTFFIVGNDVWVITSKVYREKGVVVDVFNKKGVYTDSFFLDCGEYGKPHRIPHWLRTYKNGHFYAVENIDDEYSIVKYTVSK
jgi:hypothetical protein